MSKAISKDWEILLKDYKILELLGNGSFGTVVKALDRRFDKLVAIKLIKNFNKTSYKCRQVLREIVILRKLSQSKENLFSPKLLDIILPDDVFKRNEVNQLIEDLQNDSSMEVKLDASPMSSYDSSMGTPNS